MHNYQKNVAKFAYTILFSSVISGCGNSKSNQPSTSNPPIEAFPTSELFLDFNLPFSILDRSMPDVSGITFNYEENYFLISSAAGDLLFISPAGEVIDELNTSSSFTGIEFIEDGAFLLSDVNRVLKYSTDNHEIEELHSFVGQYENIQSIAYREETKEVVFVNNGDTPALVYVSQDGAITELTLNDSFGNYAIDGLQLSGNYIFMGSTGYKLEDATTRNSVVIQTQLNGDFVQAWELDQKVLSGVAILDKNAPEFITTNQEEDGSFNLYEPEALPSAPSEQPLNVQSSIELDFDQPSGIDYLISNNTFYYITDFGEVRSGKVEEANELLFEIETQQGSYEAIAASLNNDDEIELHVINSDDSVENTQIEKYNVDGELLEQFPLTLIQKEHLFESLDFDPSTNRYYTINSNDESRKYLYVFDNGSTETFELPSDYDDYYISGLDYSVNTGYLYFVTEEFENQSGKNAGLMIIYDIANAVEIERYSIVDTTEPEVGLETPSGITINDDESEIYITSDVDGSTLHHYAI
ncbi:MAG: hypothetical protein ABJH28_09210 [Paraglaciecola sp.]|uniref:hypothetical protein n=2 Tax=Paraglaciecola sp. TaxID=1920173 RepID=UPI003264156A